MAAKKRRTTNKSALPEKDVPKLGVEALDRLREKNKQIENDHERESSERGRAIDKHRRNVIGSLYAVALNLKQDRKEWKLLCGNPYWESAKKKPNASKQDDVLRYVIHYFYETTGNKSSQKQASKHFKLLQPYFEQGASAGDVRSALKKGVEKLRREASDRSSKEKNKYRLQFKVNSGSFDKLVVGKVIRRLELEITSISGRIATARIVKKPFKTA